MQASVTELDFIEEIRLRRWARENYVPVDARDEALHPIVLEEMQKKDLESSPDDDLVVQNENT